MSPLGYGRQGRIDRLMDAVTDHIAGRINLSLEIQFVPTATEVN